MIAFQTEMEEFFHWAKINNMSFNGDKFVVLRYGKDQEIKNDTTYFTDDWESPIGAYSHHKDLGIYMSDSRKFDHHIDELCKKVRKRIGWICRTFFCRDISFMRRIYIAVIRPHIDYCSQVWAQSEGVALDRVEKLQADFTRLVPEIRELRYEQRLKAMRLQSIQRRFDRYRILYIRKSVRGEVPSLGVQVRDKHNSRDGLKLIVPSKKGMSVLRSDSLTVRGPELWNCLPADLREIALSKETFKHKLDEFLELIMDEPRIGGCRLNSNKLDVRVSQWEWSLRNYSL